MKYHYWRHKPTGNVYAVRLDAASDRPTGVAGPLDPRDVTDANLAAGSLQFDNPEAVNWVEAHIDEFELLEAATQAGDSYGTVDTGA